MTKTKLSDQDRFNQFFREKYGEEDVETAQVVEDLDKQHWYFTRERVDRAIREWKFRQVTKLLSSMPKQDKDGKPVERVHMARATKEGTKDVLVQRLNLTFEERNRAAEECVAKGERFYREARKILEHAFKELRTARSQEAPREVEEPPGHANGVGVGRG